MKRSCCNFLCILLLCVCAGCGDESVLGTSVRVERKTLLVSLDTDGTVRPANETTITPKVRQGAPLVWICNEGTRVKKGDVVARLESASFEDRREELQNSILIKKAGLLSQEKRNDQALRRQKRAVAVAALKLELAKLRRRTAIEPSDIDKASARADVFNRKTILANRKEEGAILEALFRKGFATRSELDQKKLEIARAEADYQKSKIKMRRIIEGLTESEKRKLDIEVSLATNRLDVARKNITKLQRKLTSTINSMKLNLGRTERQLADAERDIANADVRVEGEGLVLMFQEWHSSWYPGKWAWPGARICLLCDLSEMKIAFKLRESRISTVRVGQPVRVRVHAMPGVIFTGRVSHIALQGKDEFEDLQQATRDEVSTADIRVFDIEALLDGPRESIALLRPGMRARTSVHVEEVNNALVVPRNVVTEENGGYVVHVITDAGVERRTIKPGRSSDTELEVRAGLSEGEQVLFNQ